MEQFFGCADQWVFDYMVYRFVTNYTADPFRTIRTRSKFRSRRHCSVMKDLIHEGLDHMPPNQRKSHFLLLLFLVQEIEKISLGLKEADSDDDNDDIEVKINPVLSMEDSETICSLLTDMQRSLIMFLNEQETESLRTFTRKCLVDSLVIRFQYCLRIGSGEKEVLETLEKFVNESNNPEEMESYQFCHNLKPVSGKFRPISGFISSMKELISAINSCFEIPHLMQFAMTCLENSNSVMEQLLQDQRPSREADVMEFFVGLSDSRKEELDLLMANTEAQSFPDMSEVGQKLQPSSLSLRLQEDQRIEPSNLSSTSRIQEEHRIQPSSSPSTSRIQDEHRIQPSTQSTSSRIQSSNLSNSSRVQGEQRIQPSTLPSTSGRDEEQTLPLLNRSNSSNIQSTSNGTPTKDCPGTTYMSALGKRLKEFSTKDCMVKLRKIDVQMKKSKKYLGPPSHQVARLGPWLPEEENLFIEETLKVGIGKWTMVKEALGTARSSQQLKDKWRNISQNTIKEVAIRLNIKYP